MTPEVDGRGVTIRCGNAEDFGDVIALLRQLWPELKADPVVLEGVFRECLQSEGYFALCAVAGKSVVGFCDLTIRPSLWQSGKLAYVDELVVEESARGKGIGAQLLERAAEIASRHGCGHIALDSFFHREDAHRFYEQCGLKRNGFIFGRDL